MTHLQDIFIRNLRFFRTEQNISQVKFSELIDVSPNYLNAVENGKNFPSVEVIQRMVDKLHILPYQLFLEQPAASQFFTISEKNKIKLLQELISLKQKISRECDEMISNITKN